jgi:hypothetical protein
VEYLEPDASVVSFQCPISVCFVATGSCLRLFGVCVPPVPPGARSRHTSSPSCIGASTVAPFGSGWCSSNSFSALCTDLVLTSTRNSRASWSRSCSAGSRVQAVPVSLSICPPLPRRATLIHPFTTPRHRDASGVREIPIAVAEPLWSVCFLGG